jgi:hypothetical protein
METKTVHYDVGATSQSDDPKEPQTNLVSIELIRSELESDFRESLFSAVNPLNAKQQEILAFIRS